MTKRDRIVLGIVALVAVLGGFYLGVVKPNGQEVEELDTQITTAEQRRDTALAELQTAKAAREQYLRDQQTLAVLGKAVPSDDGVPSLLYQLHKSARAAGITVDTIAMGGGSSAGAANGEDATPGTTTGPGGLSALPLKIAFRGTFFKLDRFLRSIQAYAEIGEERVDVRGRLLTVDSISLSPNEGTSTLTAEVSAVAYVAPKAAKSANATAATTADPSATSSTSSAPATTTSSSAATPSASSIPSDSGAAE